MDISIMGKFRDFLGDVLSISSESDLNKILAKTTEGAATVANAEGGGLALIDMQSGELEIRAKVNRGEKSAKLMKVRCSDALINQVVKTGQSLRVDEGQIEIIDGLLVNSLLCVPFASTEKGSGALYVYNKTSEESFSEDDEFLLSHLTNIAANTIQKSGRLRDIDRQHDLDIINNIVHILSINPDPKGIYCEVVRQIARELKCTHCTLFLPKRKDGSEYLVSAASWEQTGGIFPDRTFKSDEGLIGMVYKKASSQIFSDAARHSDFAPGKRLPDYHPRSILISPILSGGDTIGLICADQDQTNWFTENDLRLVDAMAVHIGIAIERSLAFSAIKKISETLIGTLNPDNMNYILDLVLKTAVELTTATTGVIYLLDDDKKTIVDSKAHPDPSFHPPPRTDDNGNFIGLTKEAIESKKGFVIEDAENDVRVNPDLQKKIKSMAIYPLISQNNISGVLFLDDEDGHRYTQVEILVLETLANQVGIALASYNLIRRLEKSEEEYKKLFEESVKARDGITSKMFYGEISHSVKNVLAQIEVNLDLISKSSSIRKLSNTQRDRLEQLITEVDKSSINIEKFLDLASESEGETADYEIGVLVNHAIRLLDGKIEKNKIIVDASGLNDKLVVNVNATQMIMAFLNLIDNAIDALMEVNRPRKLRIFTRVSNDSPWVEIGFEDNGCGISHENLDKIFEPFFSTKVKRGHGIGLLGSRRIIERHFGKLPKPLSTFGKGTKFTVYLPQK